MAVRGTRILAGGVQMLLHTGTQLGVERGALLEAAGLTDAALTDRDRQLPFEHQIALGQAIVDALPGVHIGIEALKHVSPAVFGVVGYVISNCRDLEESLQMFVRYQRLATDGVRWRLRMGRRATLELDADARYARLGYPIEALIGVWMHLGRMITGTMWTPTAVSFQHAPLGDPAEIERHFGTRVRFRAPHNALELERDTLALPLVVGSMALQPSLRHLADAQLAAIDGHPTLTAELRALMFEQIPKGVTDKARLAKQLGVSTRTLTRRLGAEETSFRDLLDDTRRELALAWLRDPQHSVYDVAFLLGYSEPSTFHRSFRRWTGSSPRVWRTKHTAR